MESDRSLPKSDWTVAPLLVQAAALNAGSRSPAVEKALRAVGLPRRLLLDRKARIRLNQEVDFFEEMARHTGDDLYGLKAGLAFQPKGTNLNSYILFASRDLREALNAAVRFAPLERGAADYRLTQAGGGHAALSLDTLDAYERFRRQSTEFHVAMVLRYLRAATGSAFPLEGVSFAHQRSFGRDEAEALLGCPVEYGASSSALHFSGSVLELPIPTQDDALCDILLEHGEMLSRQRGAQRPDIVAQVERAVLDHLPRGGVQMPELAAELGVSERTLARRMSAHGLTLRGLTEELRRELAVSYLADPGLTLGQICYLLGYSEPSAFSAAFRRWFGVPPGKFREDLGKDKDRASPRSLGRGGGPGGMAR